MKILDDLFLAHLGPSLARHVALARATEGLPGLVDMEAGKVAFGNRYTFSVQYLGKQSQRDGVNLWRWSWAPQEEAVPKAVIRDTLELKKYGERHGLDIFYIPCFEAEKIGGDELAILACGLTKSDAFFIAGTEADSDFFLIPDLGDQLSLERPVHFVAEIVAAMLEGYEIQNHKGALRSYLTSESYEIDEQSSRRWAARNGRGEEITLDFDALDRLAALNASAG